MNLFRRINQLLYVSTTLLMLTQGKFLYSEATNEGSTSSRYLKNIDTTEFILENGLKVLVKPTDFEPGEIYMQLTAQGGYSALNKEMRPSGILASKIALESGLGTHSANELSYILYRDTIDLNVSIEKNHRMIDVTTRPHSLDSVFRILKLIFQENKLEQSALEKVVDREKEIIRNRHVDSEQYFETMYFALNTQNSKALKPLSLKATKRVDLAKAKEFFQRCFSNPSEFTLVIVGDVDVNSVKSLLNKHLGNIENIPEIKGPTYPPPPAFPEGVTKRVVPKRYQTDAYARITIPLKLPLNQKNIEVFDVMNLLIEKKLREVIKEETGKTFGVDVGYELPLFPNPDCVWLIINYHSPKDKVQKIEKLIMNEVRRLRKEVVTEEEFSQVVKHQQQSEEFWYKDDCYWLAKLANYNLWEWEIAEIPSEPSKAYEQLKASDVKEFLHEATTCSNYTLITSSP